MSEPFYLSDWLMLSSLRLTSRTIWSIWNGCKRLGSFSNVARHFAKTVSGLFCSCLHSSMMFWIVSSHSSRRIGDASLIRYLGEGRLHSDAFLSTTILAVNGESDFRISPSITAFGCFWSNPLEPIRGLSGRPQRPSRPKWLLKRGDLRFRSRTTQRQ